MGPKKKPTPAITGQGFAYPRDPSQRELDACVVPSFQRATVLREAGWNGGLYGCIGLELSNDNRNVHSGHFCMFGNLFRNPVQAFQAAKFWEGANEIKLEISIDSVEIFTFTDSLASELLDSAAVSHKFIRDGQEVDTTELQELGITGFSLRAFVVPTRETYAKVIVGLFPLLLAELSDEHPLLGNPLFPAISLCSPREFALGPPTTTTRRSTRWGFPFWPLLVLGADLEDCPSFPPGEELRGKMAEVLHKAFKPEIKNGPAALLKKLERAERSRTL